MDKYTFKKQKGKYIWQSSEVKLVFCDISFQAFDDYSYVSSTRDIMYLYYTLDVYVRRYDRDKNGKVIRRWDLLTSERAYDFPAITALQYILEQYLNDEIAEEDCMALYYYHDGEMQEAPVDYVYSMDTGSFFYEDYYQIERTITKNNKDEETGRTYSLYVGSAVDFGGGSPSIGVKTAVSEEGLRCLLTCITECLKDAIDNHNQAAREFLASGVYSIDKAGRIVKTENDKVLEMFVQNDVVDNIEVYCGDLDSKLFYSNTYYHVKLSEIKEEGTTITGGYCGQSGRIYNEEYNEADKENRKLVIPCKNIFYIAADMAEEILALDEQGIAEDLKKVLTSEELAEIQNSDVEEMYQKWYEVIVDRYIIFREEHPFRKIKKDARKNAMEAVRTVLKILGAQSA